MGRLSRFLPPITWPSFDVASKKMLPARVDGQFDFRGLAWSGNDSVWASGSPDSLNVPGMSAGAVTEFRLETDGGTVNGHESRGICFGHAH